MTNDNQPFNVAANFQLVQKSFYIQRVWLPAREADKDLLSSVAWFSALELLYEYEGQLSFPNGDPYDVPDIAEVFVDPENRWMRNFLEPDESGKLPKRFSGKHERLRLIELYCRLIPLEPWSTQKSA